MPTKSELQHRKSLVHAIANEKRLESESSMPISKQTLAALFDYLDVALGTGCDHSLKHTREFLRTHELAESVVIPWLGQYGGYCDCEVLGNVEEAWSK